MSSYTYVKSGDRWAVVETMSGNTLAIFDRMYEAAEHAYDLIEKSAFEGWTPAFVLREMPVKLETTA